MTLVNIHFALIPYYMIKSIFHRLCDGFIFAHSVSLPANHIYKRPPLFFTHRCFKYSETEQYYKTPSRPHSLYLHNGSFSQLLFCINRYIFNISSACAGSIL